MYTIINNVSPEYLFSSVIGFSSVQHESDALTTEVGPGLKEKTTPLTTGTNGYVFLEC